MKILAIFFSFLGNTCWGMSRGKPCNHCGFEKPFPFLACVCSIAFSSSLITQITSQKSKNKKQSRPERENETHESKGTKPRN